MREVCTFLSSVFKKSSALIYKWDLCLTRTSLPEAVFRSMNNLIDVEMTHHLRADNVFHHLGIDRCQRNRAIVGRCGVMPSSTARPGSRLGQSPCLPAFTCVYLRLPAFTCVYLRLPEWPNTRSEACRGRKDNLFTPPPHILSYSILNCSVDLLQIIFSGSAFQGMTTRCEKKFLRGSHLDLSLYIFKLCPLRRVSPLVKKVSSHILSNPCIILCISSRSPLFRLSSNVVSLHSDHMATFSMKLSSW